MQIFDLLKPKKGIFIRISSPLVFSTVQDEYTALTNNKTVCFDLSFLGTIKVTGNDRITFLHKILSNDVKNLKPNKVCEASLLSNQGRMIGFFHVHSFPDYLLLVTNRIAVEDMLHQLEKFHISEQVHFTDETNSFLRIGISGGESQSFLEELLIPDFQKIGFNECHIINSNSAIVSRRGGFLKEFYELTIPMASDKIQNTILEAFKTSRVQPVGYDALNAVRIESGIPLFGIDMDQNTIPLEINETFSVSLNKGCYIGQEIITRMARYKQVARKFAGFTSISKAELQTPEKLFLEEKEVGKLTSYVFSQRFEKSIGLGFIKSACKYGSIVKTKEGDELTVSQIPFVP